MTATETTDLAMRNDFSREHIELLKRTICAGATDDELALFVQTSKRLSLDPFARQVFAVKRWDSKKRIEVMAIQVSIDGFRLVAERTGKYAGQLGPFWTADGKEWLEVWLSKEPPAAAKVAVLRTDFREPLWSVATWEQYKQEGREGITPMWRRMGPLMLGKCAESLALRRAFPNELSGVYTAEEMDQAGPVADYTPPVADEVKRSPTTGAPVGGNVPVPNKAGRGSWPKEQGEHAADKAMREMDRDYARTINGHAPSDLEATLQRSIDANTIEVVDNKTGEVTQEPKATAAQLKKIRAMCNEMNISESARKAGMLKYYKINSSTLLTKAQAQDMIDRMEIVQKKLQNAHDSVTADMAAFAEDRGDVPDPSEMEPA